MLKNPKTKLTWNTDSYDCRLRCRQRRIGAIKTSTICTMPFSYTCTCTQIAVTNCWLLAQTETNARTACEVSKQRLLIALMHTAVPTSIGVSVR